MASKIQPGDGVKLADLLTTNTLSQTTIWTSQTHSYRDQ